MQTKTVTVPGISCGHCVNTIQNEVSELGGVTSVKADQQTKLVTIQWDKPADWDTIKATLVEIGYAPAE
jgi:copper chaperone CopZ